MPIIPLTFTERRNNRYITTPTEQLAALCTAYQAPETPDGIQYRMPKLDKPTVSMTKNLFPPLGVVVWATVYLKSYDFDNQEGERIIGANFQCSAFTTTPPIIKPKVSLAKPVDQP